MSHCQLLKHLAWCYPLWQTCERLGQKKYGLERKLLIESAELTIDNVAWGVLTVYTTIIFKWFHSGQDDMCRTNVETKNSWKVLHYNTPVLWSARGLGWLGICNNRSSFLRNVCNVELVISHLKDKELFLMWIFMELKQWWGVSGKHW